MIKAIKMIMVLCVITLRIDRGGMITLGLSVGSSRLGRQRGATPRSGQ